MPDADRADRFAIRDRIRHLISPLIVLALWRARSVRRNSCRAVDNNVAERA